MRYEDYLNQHDGRDERPAEASPAPSGGQFDPLEAIALHDQLEAVKALIDDPPPLNDAADLLALVAAELFGENSPQVDAMKKYGTPDVDGYAVTMDTIRKQQKALQRLRRNLTEQLQSVENAITATTTEAQTLSRYRDQASRSNRAVDAVLSLWSVPEGKLLSTAEGLVENHHDDPAAMGLLYGTLGELMSRDTLQEYAMTLPVIEQLTRIRERALEAMQK